jgi:predicted lipase
LRLWQSSHLTFRHFTPLLTPLHVEISSVVGVFTSQGLYKSLFLSKSCYLSLDSAKGAHAISYPRPVKMTHYQLTPVAEELRVQIKQLIPEIAQTPANKQVTVVFENSEGRSYGGDVLTKKISRLVEEMNKKV